MTLNIDLHMTDYDMGNFPACVDIDFDKAMESSYKIDGELKCFQQEGIHLVSFGWVKGNNGLLQRYMLVRENERLDLWKNIEKYMQTMVNQEWHILGDFNDNATPYEQVGEGKLELRREIGFF